MNSKHCLMIVDDDEDDREFFCEAVKEINYNVECLTAINGEDALHKLKYELQIKPDFIFLDLNMPRMNGTVCLSELKKDDYLKDIPVIIYSTSSSQKEIDGILKLGAISFINKPTSLKKLHDYILEVVDKVGITI